MDENENIEMQTLFKPVVGSAFAVASGLFFFLLCMILPLVGPSGSRQPHYPQNRAAFVMILLSTFVLSALAVWSKLGRRKIDGSPKPNLSIGLCVLCILTLVVFLLGGFEI